MHTDRSGTDANQQNDQRPTYVLFMLALAASDSAPDLLAAAIGVLFGVTALSIAACCALYLCHTARGELTINLLSLQQPTSKRAASFLVLLCGALFGPKLLQLLPWLLQSPPPQVLQRPSARYRGVVGALRDHGVVGRFMAMAIATKAPSLNASRLLGPTLRQRWW